MYQIALITRLLALAILNQTPVAQYDQCKVTRQENIISVVVNQKTTWKTKAIEEISDYDYIDKYIITDQDPLSKRFFVFNGCMFGELTLFNPNGMPIGKTIYGSAQDSRALFFNPPYIVYGDGNFNWIDYDDHALNWQNKSRAIRIVNIRNGEISTIRKFKTYGLALTVWKSELCWFTVNMNLRGLR